MAKRKKSKASPAQTRDLQTILTSERIGLTQELTSEGYLLCKAVPIARTGDMLYLGDEVPVESANDGLVTISRNDSDLFDNDTIASFEGKPVTDDHPDDWVDPKNWRDLAVGITYNVRRGTGSQDNLLLADLLITRDDAIKNVMDGKREVSCGYDADYQQIAMGRGVQRNIRGNHVALVDKGRCGSRCAIGDSEMTQKTLGILSKHLGFLDKAVLQKTAKVVDRAVDSAADVLRKELPWLDKKTVDKVAKAIDADCDDDDDTKDGDDDDDESGKTGDSAVLLKAINKLAKTVDQRIGKLEKRFKDADGDDDTKDGDDDETKDTIIEAEETETKSDAGEKSWTGDSLKKVLSQAEILSPGIKLPTLDAKTKDVGAKVKDCKCKALAAAYKTDDGKKAIDLFLGGAAADFDKLPAAVLDAAFIGASTMMGQANNQRGARTGVNTKDFGKRPPTIAEINAANQKYWADKK